MSGSISELNKVSHSHQLLPSTSYPTSTKSLTPTDLVAKRVTQVLNDSQIKNSNSSFSLRKWFNVFTQPTIKMVKSNNQVVYLKTKSIAEKCHVTPEILKKNLHGKSEEEILRFLKNAHQSASLAKNIMQATRTVGQSLDISFGDLRFLIKKSLEEKQDLYIETKSKQNFLLEFNKEKETVEFITNLTEDQKTDLNENSTKYRLTDTGLIKQVPVITTYIRAKQSTNKEANVSDKLVEGNSNQSFATRSEQNIVTESSTIDELVEDNFNRIFAKGLEEKDGELYINKELLGLTSASLKERIKQILINKKGALVDVEGKQFLLEFDSEKNRVFFNQIGKELGSGTFGAVHKITNLKGAQKAIKLGHTEKTAEEYNLVASDDSVMLSYQNEVALINYIHEKGTVSGVQSPFKRVTVVTDDSGEERVGLLGPLYTGDLFSRVDEAQRQARLSGNKLYLTPSYVEARIKEMKSLFEGLAGMHTVGVVHGDLKAENILVNDEKNLVHIADLGGARNMSSFETDWTTEFPTFTPFNVTYSDITLLNGIRKDGRTIYNKIAEMESRTDINSEDEILEELYAEYVDTASQFAFFMSKLDVFAMGSTMYSLFSGFGDRNLPYDLEAKIYQQQEVKFAKESEFQPINALTDRLNNLLAKMLDFDSVNRINAQEALEEFNKIIKEDYSRLSF